MNWRLIKRALFVVGVIALCVWIAKHTRWEEDSISMPLRGEAARNPFYAARRLAEVLGAHAQWRRALGEMPPSDSVLVLSKWNWALVEQRRQRLEHWVESGGRLVTDATLIDPNGRFQAWSGIVGETRRDRESNEAVDVDKQASEAGDKAAAKRPRSGSLCTTLRPAAPENSADEHYYACGTSQYVGLSSHATPEWSLKDEDGIQALRMRVGRGSVTVVNGALFTYRSLLDNDHGPLFVAATQLHRGDSIAFLSEEQHASLLELIWMYGAPVVVLASLAFAGALWRGGARFGPALAPAERGRRSLSEQIVGTGRFTLRFGAGRALHAAMVRSVHEAAAKRLPGYSQLAHAARLEQLARAAGVDVERLAATINYAGPRRSHEFKEAVELLEQVRRRVSVKSSAGEIAHAG